MDTGTDSTTAAPTRERSLGIAVGFDGSPNSEVALRCGAELAARRGTDLTVLTVYRRQPQFYATYTAIPQDADGEAARHAAEEILRGAESLMATGPHGPVTLASLEGDSVGALADASARAELMVVGARGRGGFLDRLLGSVSDALPGHARCPVLVVPEGGEPTDGSVLVGTDGSAHGRRALDHAAREAAERGAALRIVMALPLPDSGEFWYPILSDGATELVERRRSELEAELERELDRVRGEAGGLEVTGQVSVGRPAEVLREAGRDAALTVVGSRGRGAVASALLGSVSREVLHGATGPVLVVPPDPEL